LIKEKYLKKIIIINGPNLNLIGVREPEIYGSLSFKKYVPVLRNNFKDADIKYYQSNHEGDIIDKLHECGFNYDGIILNAGAYSHTSIAIADAIRGINSPVVEVHISDLSKREKYRHHSFVKEVAVYSISGLGMKGYEEALKHLLYKKPNQEI
jgi:3-dehydroquinate dehydratase-2